MKISSVIDEDGKPFPGKGFAIDPSTGNIYAPFDSQIKFTFGTKHAFEIVSKDGLQVVVHVGLGTVNLRGEGFETFYDDGQNVKQGDLLLQFDRDLALKNGYKDTVVVFYTQPKLINSVSSINAGEDVKHGDKIVDVEQKSATNKNAVNEVTNSNGALA